MSTNKYRLWTQRKALNLKMHCVKCNVFSQALKLSILGVIWAELLPVSFSTAAQTDLKKQPFIEFSYRQHNLLSISVAAMRGVANKVWVKILANSSGVHMFSLESAETDSCRAAHSRECCMTCCSTPHVGVFFITRKIILGSFSLVLHILYFLTLIALFFLFAFIW